MRILIILNDAPYGTEKSYNGLRMANTLLKNYDDVEVQVFLLADAVNCAIPNQKTANGYYNIERLIKAIISKGAEVKLCGSCCEARGLTSIISGSEKSNMNEFAEWTKLADKVLTF